MERDKLRYAGPPLSLRPGPISFSFTISKLHQITILRLKRTKHSCVNALQDNQIYTRLRPTPLQIWSFDLVPLLRALHGGEEDHVRGVGFQFVLGVPEVDRQHPLQSRRAVRHG